MGVIQTKVFKSGNSAAVRLPKELGFAPGTPVMVEKVGRDLRISLVAETPEQIKERHQRLFADLAALGPAGEIEERQPIEFPDRPGLY